MSATRRILIMAGLGIGTLGSAKAQQVGTKERPLTIATGRFFGYLPAYRVADTLKAQGITTKLIEFPSATERLEAVAAGYADMSYAGLTASVLLRARGKDIVIVASTDEKGRALVAKENVKSIADLKGKAIGVTFASIEHMTLLALLRDKGLDPRTDVKVINVPNADLPVALQGGSIDAYMGFEPVAAFGVKKFGFHIIAYPYDTILGAIDGGVEADGKFLQANRELVTKVVAAHAEAVGYFTKNPDAIIKTGVEAYKIERDVMEAALKNVDLTYKLDPKPIQALARFQVSLGLISQAEYDGIDWGKFVDTSILDAIAK